MDEIIHNVIIILLMMGFLMTVPTLGQSGGPYVLTWSAIDSGGGQSSGGQYILTGTIGHTDTSVSKGDNYGLFGGFWADSFFCSVNSPVFAVFADYWLQNGSGLAADLNGDGIVDLYDLQILTESWLCLCPYNLILKQ